ncbi:MAG: radical SAM family heme chaperone HemW [Acidimicrobiales bacterium]|nr:radical SAM family heme chaperone HemW [Acidimicrobiales bacterium]
MGVVGASSEPAGHVDEFGVYLHIPFCAHRCDYCAFATWDDRPHLLEPYLAALGREIDVAVAAGLPPATTVFLGGGTPSLLTGAQLGALLARVPLAADAEVTVEANPETITAQRCAGYLSVGVTRMSLGVQALVPATLVSLGRRHDPAVAVDAARIVAAAGFASWNLDLIYGAAGESLDDWRRTVEAAAALAPPHVSAYALTVERGTPLAAAPERHPDDDDQADKYVVVDDVLTDAGLGWYEISNWARPGHECRHNGLYWRQGDYAGFGCGAHGHRRGRRSWNVRSIERYLAAVEAGRSPEAGAEELDDETRAIEALQLALRLRAGVAASALPADALGPADGALVERSDGRARLTRQGRLLANEVAMHLTVPPAR